MSDFKDRLKIERKELSEKIEKQRITKDPKAMGISLMIFTVFFPLISQICKYIYPKVHYLTQSKYNIIILGKSSIILLLTIWHIIINTSLNLCYLILHQTPLI